MYLNDYGKGFLLSVYAALGVFWCSRYLNNSKLTGIWTFQNNLIKIECNMTLLKEALKVSHLKSSFRTVWKVDRYYLRLKICSSGYKSDSYKYISPGTFKTGELRAFGHHLSIDPCREYINTIRYLSFLLLVRRIRFRKKCPETLKTEKRRKFWLKISEKSRYILFGTFTFFSGS